jgi:hypothetical protein
MARTHNSLQNDKFFKAFLYGCLLGDGCVSRSKYKLIFTVTHSVKQLSYQELKSKILNRKIKQIISGKKSYKPGTIAYRIDYSNKSILESIYNTCIVNGNKCVTKEWLDQLNPFSLAIWYQDDGSWYKRISFHNGKPYERTEITLHTDGFGLDSVILLSNYLRDKYNIANRIGKRHYKNGTHDVYYQIVIQDRQKFWTLISPWSSIKYKFNWDMDPPWFDHDSFGMKLLKVMDDYSLNEEFDNLRYIEYDGERLPLFKLAQKCNMKPDVIRYRLNAGWSLNKIIGTPPYKAKCIEFNGKCQKVSDWAKELNINPITLHNRLNKWAVEKALTHPVR